MTNIVQFPSTFYFMRHAQTDAHVKKLICGGCWDLPLNSEGLVQAKVAAGMYTSAFGHIDRIFCSPLVRARQTAEVFSHSLQVPITVEEGLKEWMLGDWDRQPYESIPDLFTRADDPPKGEKRKDFEKRIGSSLAALANEKGPVLIVSHGAVWFSLLKILKIESRHIGSVLPYRFDSNGEKYTIRGLAGEEH